MCYNKCIEQKKSNAFQPFYKISTLIIIITSKTINMKQKLLKKSLLLFLSGIIIVSCTIENEALHEHHHKNGIKIETISYADLMKKSQFSRAVKRIPKKQVITQDFMGRSVVEDTYGFTILDAPVKVIEVDNKTSYTLQVVTDENTTGELENLILFENPIDDKIGHIVTYNTLATASETENEIVEAGIKEATTITTTDTNKGVVSMVLTYYCKAYGTSADCGGTNAATGCYQYWEMTVSSGGGDGAAGFGEPADAGNAEIGVVEGSGGNANPSSEEEDNTVVISPTHCPGGCPVIEAEIEEDLATKPCKKISNQLAKFPTMKQDLIDLATKTTEAVEHGIYSLDGYTGTETDAIKIVPAGTAGMINVDLNPSTPYVMLAHTHNSPANTTFSIFSWNDMLLISYLLSKDHIKVNEFIFYVFTADGTRYAMTISDKQKFIDTFYNMKSLNMNEIVDFEKMNESQKIYKKYFDSHDGNVPLIKVDSNPNDDKLNFLKLMKENNIGADLFEVSADLNTFTKLKLNNINTIIVPEPCN